jgi:hypothetical protein
MIASMLEAWDGPLTWDRVGERTALVLGRPFTRQALDGHLAIKAAFQARKRRLRRIREAVRSGKQADDEMPPELAFAIQRADALQTKVDRLQATLDAYEAKFVVWLFNARAGGLSEERLNTPLAPVDRGAEPDPGHRKTSR